MSHIYLIQPRTESILNSDEAELFENVATFKYLGLVEIMIECMHEKIRIRLNLRKTLLPFVSLSFVFLSVSQNI